MVISDKAKDRAQRAVDFITSCCSSVGAFRGTSDVNQFLKETADEMAESGPSDVFPDRYKEHVAFAIDMVASNRFTSSPAAIASVYLATRFEFYFRILSRKLNGEGTWVSPAAKTAAQSEIKDRRLKSNQISCVALTYNIMKLDQTRCIVQHCNELDKAMFSTPIIVVGPMTVADIGDRIKFGRHAVSHGHWGDISAEALFYGLMTSLVFYSEA